MVFVSLFDQHRRYIRNFDATKDLSNEIFEVSIGHPFDAQETNFKVLTTMLKSSANKFNRISVSKTIWEESPEVLAVLALICNKARNLKLECDFRLGGTATGCLMGALLQWNGIQELDIVLENITSSSAGLLCEGVASSSCLQKLKLFVALDGPFDIGDAIIHALRRNRSLKELTFDVEGLESNQFVPQLLDVAIIPETKVISLSVVASGQLPIDVLEEVLCSSNCELETLKMQGFDTTVEEPYASSESICQTTSTKELTLSDISNLGISKTIKFFMSLVHLDLSRNMITSLRFWDSCMFYQNSTLQSLSVYSNRIASVEMLGIISQLRNAKHLKCLEISDNPWQDSDSDSVKAALMDVVSTNTSLELIDVECLQVGLSLDLNRGGRRAFVSKSPQSIPVTLWPELLARASMLTYYCVHDNWRKPTDAAPRSDVIFWLLSRMSPQL